MESGKISVINNSKDRDVNGCCLDRQNVHEHLALNSQVHHPLSDRERTLNSV